jgi:hypothetical protein
MQPEESLSNGIGIAVIKDCGRSGAGVGLFARFSLRAAAMWKCGKETLLAA